jgi:hypothetical protein
MIPRATKILALIGIFALAVSFAFDRYIAHRFHQYDFEPVREPIEVAEGFTLTKAFTVEYASDYDVGLECRRALPHERLDGILQSDLALGYSVFQDGALLTQVDSITHPGGGRYTSDTITRMLGSFPAHPGRDYRIDVRVGRTIHDLPATLPTLVVEIDSIVWKTEFYAPAIPFAMAQLASGATGLLLLCFAGAAHLRHWFRKRRSKLQSEDALQTEQDGTSNGG